MPDGLAYDGILEGAQAAYTGVPNGMKACAGGTHASFGSNNGYASCNTVASITCP